MNRLVDRKAVLVECGVGKREQSRLQGSLLPERERGNEVKRELTLVKLTCAFWALHSSPHSLTPPLFFSPPPSPSHFQFLTAVV